MPVACMPAMPKARRLDQLLSSLGHGSRREVRELIGTGVVAFAAVASCGMSNVVVASRPIRRIWLLALDEF